MNLRTLNLLLFLCFYFSGVFAEVFPDSLYSIRPSSVFSRQRLELLQSCAHLNKNEIRLGIYYASEALKHAREAKDAEIELMSLQLICDGYNRQQADVQLSYFANQLLKLASSGGRSNGWYEAMALYYQAFALIRGGENSQGIRLLQLAAGKMEKDKKNRELFSFAITAKRADLYKEEGNYEKSRQLLNGKLEELENIDAKDSTRKNVVGLGMSLLKYHSQLMEICQLVGKDTEAVQHYRQTRALYALYPAFPEIPLLLSRYLVKAGQYKQAETFLHALLDRQRATGDTLNECSLQYLRLLAEVYTKQGRFEEANGTNWSALVVSDTLQRRNDRKARGEWNALDWAEEYETIITRQQYIILYGRIFLGVFVGSVFMAVAVKLYRERSAKGKKGRKRPVSSLLSSDGTDQTDLIYTNICQYVITEQHYLDKNIDIAEVGRHCHMPKDRVNKVLIQKTNRTLLDLVNNCRLEQACVLLLDPANKTIDVIASESGFNTTRTFLRQFKAKYQMSPSEYKRRNR